MCVTCFFAYALHQLDRKSILNRNVTVAAQAVGFYAQHLAETLLAAEGMPTPERTRQALTQTVLGLREGGQAPDNTILYPARDRQTLSLLRSQQTLQEALFQRSDDYIKAVRNDTASEGMTENLLLMHAQAQELATNTVRALERVADDARRDSVLWLTLAAVIVLLIGLMLAFGIQRDVSLGLEIEVQERRQVQHQLQRALAASPNAVVLTDGEGHVVLASAEATRLFGYSNEQFSQKTVLHLFAGCERERTAAYLQWRTRLTPHASAREPIETLGQRADGKLFPIELAANGIVAGEGVTLLVSMINITERKAAEDMLLESERRYRSIVETAHDLIFSLSLEGTFTFVNRASEQFFGLPPEALVGHNIEEFLDPSEVEEARQTIAEVMDGRPEYDGETTIVARDGSRKHILVNLVPVADDAGLSSGIIGTASDLTKQRRAQEQFRLAVELNPNAIIIVGSDGNIVYANERTSELFGYNSQELRGLPVARLVPAEVREKHLAQVDDYFNKPDARPMGHGQDLHGIHKDGSRIPIEVGLTPFKSEEGEFVMASVIDISPRRQNERLLASYSEQLERVNEDLAQRNIELDEFAYAASHDLQEPLRKLNTFSDWLRRDLDANNLSEVEKDLQVIQNSARRMSHLIRDLLELSRSGRGTMRWEPVDLNRCVREVLDILSVAIEQSHARIIVPELPSVMGDWPLLRQLYQNLIANAVKFVAIGPPVVELTVEKKDSGVILGVKDNGIGIPEGFTQQIFVPFKRLHARGEYDGSGLGLSIAQKIVDRHQGTIWVESREGEGSHFRFELVAAPPARQEEDALAGERSMKGAAI